MNRRMPFFLTHAQKLGEKYAGKYIGVVDNKVIAVGNNRLEVYKTSIKNIPKNKGIGIFYLPRKEEVLTAL